jgi:ABC-type glycerol-3-phosphate transport system permease component
MLSWPTLAGYGFGRKRYNFGFRGWLFALLLFGLLCRRPIMYIPQFTMMASYHMLNSRLALVLLYAALGLASEHLLDVHYYCPVCRLNCEGCRPH